ncbi:hypothetical protein RHMOL_Rhmol04G0238200 [Rhododendron molle]|uniref:Uncharacterized protein n=1 Tax=Rhododendron molle TaxID=49168 RepID=A0ACC0P4Y6_RHOML|nr:hypothetical protein RHMOL_Rhmol04G0238200 [Rhododendron molle]
MRIELYSIGYVVLLPVLTSLNLCFHSFSLNCVYSIKQGGCEALDRSCGCCGSFVEDDVQREHCESVCDFATHVFCHPCALCQEGRELRRRLPHPGFKAQPILAMAPPRDQTMGRGKA